MLRQTRHANDTRLLKVLLSEQLLKIIAERSIWQVLLMLAEKPIKAW